MAVTAGVYGLTLEKMMEDTSGESASATSNVKVLMTTDSYTPDFTTHDFRNDITNEVSGTGYTTGGMTVTGNTVTVATGTLTFDVTTDPVWSTATITSAEAAVYYLVVGADTTDQLLALSDFGSPYSSTAGDFTITVAANGVFYIDFTP